MPSGVSAPSQRMGGSQRCPLFITGFAVARGAALAVGAAALAVALATALATALAGAVGAAEASAVGALGVGGAVASAEGAVGVADVTEGSGEVVEEVGVQAVSSAGDAIASSRRMACVLAGEGMPAG